MKAISDDNIIIKPLRNKKEKTLPENGLLLVNPSEASECLRQLKETGGESRFLFNSGMVVAAESSFFVAGPAIGAPMAVLSLEKMIALGAKRVILFGWCGAISKNLKVGDILVPARAVSGEGTSRYYSPDFPITPDSGLSAQVEKVLTGNGLTVFRDYVWSTDAIYREDRRMLESLYVQQKVGAVDMEYSALCAVANFRKIAFTAVLTVSDELWGNSWKPGFKKKRFKDNKQTALQQLLERICHFGEI